jgi:hypothetical protein
VITQVITCHTLVSATEFWASNKCNVAFKKLLHSDNLISKKLEPVATF